MRRTILILIIAGLQFSCSNNSNNRNSEADTSRAQTPSAVQAQQQRQLLIGELKRLHAVIASKDKEKIADIFSFPLVDSTVSIFIDDSSYTEEYKKNGERMTRAMFIKYFPQVSNGLQFDELDQLFKTLNIDSLNQKDSLASEIVKRGEPCFAVYYLYVDKDMVMLQFGTNTNKDYVDKSKKSEEDETFGDECEFASLWWFHFDGKKLHFERQAAAG